MTLPGRRVKGERSKVKEVNSQYRETWDVRRERLL